jgi:hypothetical protein
MKPDHLRALTFLAHHRDGCTETLMLAQGFGPAVIAKLIEVGFARARTARVLAGGNEMTLAVTRGMKLTHLHITNAGRAVIEGKPPLAAGPAGPVRSRQPGGGSRYGGVKPPEG